MLALNDHYFNSGILNGFLKCYPPNLKDFQHNLKYKPDVILQVFSLFLKFCMHVSEETVDIIRANLFKFLTKFIRIPMLY